MLTHISFISAKTIIKKKKEKATKTNHLRRKLHRESFTLRKKLCEKKHLQQRYTVKGRKNQPQSRKEGRWEGEKSACRNRKRCTGGSAREKKKRKRKLRFPWSKAM